MRSITFLFCLSTFTHALAQPYPSQLGGFQVDQKEGCAPLTVTVTEVLAAGFCACDYNYDGSSTTQSKTYTYTQPGTYLIKGTFQSGVNLPGGVNTDDITIKVNPNIQPDFEISTCGGSQVQINITNKDYQNYLIDFNNDNVDDQTILNSASQTAKFSYGSTGLKTITVRGLNSNSKDNCNKKVQSFNALTNLTAPTLNTLTLTSVSSVDLVYTPDINYSYRAQISTNNTSSFQPFQTFHSTSSSQATLTLTGLSADDNFYCFRLNAIDPCNNNSIPSNIICSANFDLTIADKKNQMTWATSLTGVTDFSITRNSGAYQTTTATTYDDTNIVCNQDYCYQLTTNYSNGSKAISLEKCGTAINLDIPTRIDNASAIVTDAGNQVDLEWVQDPLFTAALYSINRYSQSPPFSKIGEATITQYSDAGYTTEGNYCYMINYIDACTNSSPDGGIVCPVQLYGSVGSINQINLNWTAYSGWKKGVKRYRIDKFSENGSFIKSFYTTDLVFVDDASDPNNQIVQYQIVAEPVDGTLTPSQSNKIILKRKARLIFPTAFTPNKDKLNDNFSVMGQYVESMTLQIFDRWGKLLFATAASEPWDGTSEGHMMPESTYIWKASLTDKSGETVTQIGTVALLRK